MGNKNSSLNNINQYAKVIKPKSPLNGHYKAIMKQFRVLFTVKLLKVHALDDDVNCIAVKTKLHIPPTNLHMIFANAETSDTRKKFRFSIDAELSKRSVEFPNHGCIN